MPAIIVDGKGIAQAVLANIREQVTALAVPLHMAAVCVGPDEGLRAFVKLKQKAAQSVGVDFSSYIFDGIDTNEAAHALAYLAADESVQGIFIELPLPAGYDRDALVALIPPEKDVDALTAHPPVPAPAVLALQYVLREHGIEPAGMNVVVVGQGQLVGVPLTKWLRAQGARVSSIDIDTPEPEAISSRADLVIAGVGKPGLVTADWVREGAIVIDYGFGKNENGAYVGDVAFESVAKKASLITSVPGGMGPLVIAAVLENLVTLVTR